MKKLNKKAVALTGLGAVVLVGGTLAYYNQTVSLDNPLHTGNYNNEMVEDFTPETDVFKPGATIDKIVGAKNTGDYPVMVRIRMDEKWQRAVKDAEGNVTGANVFVTHGSEEEGFEVEPNMNLSEYITDQQEDENDGLTTTEGVADGSVVRKNIKPLSKWTYNKNDGYWYFIDVLEPGVETGNLLESITLASNVDLGKYVTKDWYYTGTEKPASDSEDWIKYTVEREKDDNGVDVVTKIIIGEGDTAVEVGDRNNDGVTDAIDMAAYLKENKELADGQKLFRKNESLLDEEALGYADANYTLTVTSQFVQATPDALKEAFTNDEVTFDDLPLPIRNKINGLEADILGSESSEEPSEPENPENPSDPTPENPDDGQ